MDNIGVLLSDTARPPTLYRFIRLIESGDALFMDLSINEIRSAPFEDFWPLI